jgi:L-threonylcarbamoyladenylate synthase
MKTRIIPASRWQDSIELLRQGSLVVMPTDTVYGLAAMPLDAAAIESIYEAKNRPEEKALPMLVASIAEAEQIADMPSGVRLLCELFWPGPLTVVAPAAPSFASSAVATDGTVALRMPALNLALEIISSAGGVLAVTSANLSGAPPATSAPDALSQLNGRIAAIVDGGPSPGGVASTVVRIVDGRLVVIREGAIARAALVRVLDERA